MAQDLNVETVTAGVCSVYAVFSFVASLLTGDYSWVDRLWSLAPWWYIYIFAYFSDWHPRLVLCCVVSTLWGVRLTFNFWRKGGYTVGDEDYRWANIQKDLKKLAPKYHRHLWLIFNITFIATYQHVLLLLQVSAAYLASKSKAPLNGLDAVAAALFLFFVAIETTADEQQWAFQQGKRKAAPRRQELLGDYERGFLTHGLFRYSRHPNFFSEQAIWWSFYLFGVAAGAPTINLTILGPFLLSMLFQGSTWYTEKLSCAKYKHYKYYQKTTSRLLPLPAPVAFPEGQTSTGDGISSPRRNARRTVRDNKE